MRKGREKELLGAVPSGAGMMNGGLDAASRIDRTMATWYPESLSADASIIPNKDLLDARSSDVYRNDGYIRSGAAIRQNRIVGDMFMLSSKPNLKVLRLDEQWEDEFQEEVEAKFTLYAESPECWIHAGGSMTFTDIIRLAVGLDVSCGEFLATVEWLRGNDRPYQTAIQVIDTNRLSTPTGAIEGSRLRGGVAKDQWGKPLGYYIRNAHPSESYIDADAWTWKYVPARKPWGRRQVIHNFDPWQADQTRGVSDLVAVLKEIRITRRFRDVTLQNAVLNATYAASIESDLPSDAVYNAMGGGLDTPGQAITQYAQEYLGSIAAYTKNSRNLHLDGVRIPHLFPGTKLNLQPVGKDSQIGSEFEKSLLRYIAANLGVGYEELSKDYTEANYSNLRASLAATERAMSAKKRRGADRIANMIFRLWLEEAINTGNITSLPRNAPSIYEGQNFDAYANCQWIGASPGQIDALKETQAAILRLKYNLSTMEDEAARLGKDWRQLLAQTARERDMRKELGIEVIESNAINAAGGEPNDGIDPDETTGIKKDE